MSSKSIFAALWRLMVAFAVVGVLFSNAMPAAAQSNQPQSTFTTSETGDKNAADESATTSQQQPQGASIAAANPDAVALFGAVMKDRDVRVHAVNYDKLPASDHISGTVSWPAKKLSKDFDFLANTVKYRYIDHWGELMPGNVVHFLIKYNGITIRDEDVTVSALSPVFISFNQTTCAFDWWNDPYFLATNPKSGQVYYKGAQTDKNGTVSLYDVLKDGDLRVQAFRNSDYTGLRGQLDVTGVKACKPQAPENKFVAVPAIDCQQNYAVTISEQQNVSKIEWLINGQPAAEPKGNLGDAKSVKVTANVTFVDGSTQAYDYPINRKTDCPSNPLPSCKAVDAKIDAATMMATVSATGENAKSWEIYETATGTVVARGDGNVLAGVQFKAKYDTNYNVRFISGDNKSDDSACAFSFKKEQTQDCPPGKVRTRNGTCESPYDIYVNGFAKSSCPNPNDIVLTFTKWGAVGHPDGWDYDNVLVQRADPIIDGWNQNDIRDRWPSIYERTGWDGMPLSHTSVFTFTWDEIHTRLGDPTISKITAWDISISKKDHSKPPVHFIFKTPVFWIQNCTPEKKQDVTVCTGYDNGPVNTTFPADSSELADAQKRLADNPGLCKAPEHHDIPTICVKLSNGHQAIVRIDQIPDGADLGANACGADGYELPPAPVAASHTNSMPFLPGLLILSNFLWIALAILRSGIRI